MENNNTEYAISIDHVSMHFNMASEKIENLKEYFIKLFKKELYFKDFVAIKDLSVKIKKGEVFGIVGTNGSGKSTILKIVSGILQPTSGSVTTVGRISPLIELGAGFDGDLTARENIFLNGAVLGYSEKFIEQHFQSIVDFAELWDFLDMPIKNYSSGMVARIAFAIATVVQPDILIVDEILGVGDFLFQQKCEKRIHELMSGGTTVLLVSHSISQIESLCDRVLWIEKGKQIMVGNTFEVCNAYKNMDRRKIEDNATKQFQIVAREKCGICGHEAEFRNEEGMTYHTESFCSHCGALLRSSDLAKMILEEKFGIEDGSLKEYRENLQDLKILHCTPIGSLKVFLKQYDGYTAVDGKSAEWVARVDEESMFGVDAQSQDLIIVENILDLVASPRKAIDHLVDLLKKDGLLMITVPVYEDKETVSRKNTKHCVYRNGVRVNTQFGSRDVDVYLAGNHAEVRMKRYHTWFEAWEQMDVDKNYELLQKSHPYYFYRFNSWVFAIRKKAGCD